MTAAEPPRGVVTFLFTDIEGSTRRWEADADTMRDALGAHDEVLHDAITDCGGEIFKHTGDGMCAAFGSPAAAVDAAIAAQRSVGLPVRMGIATGEAVQRGGDYFGPVLNRAARVMAAGHGGQILIDGQTAGLLGNTDLKALGNRRLRDISRPVEVFQVQASGLCDEFPPLKTVDRAQGNLRPTSTSFVGRETDVVELEGALGVHRLVTLTGVGGVGKTRLAMEVAARVTHDFADGVWLVELAPVGDPSAVSEALAAVLGITQQPGMTLTDSVASALEGRSRLLVFDNCEHVLDAAAELIQAIFARSSTIKILATSREGLRLREELLWPVPPLDVGAGVRSAAAQLFVERAGVRALCASPASDAAVVDICRRLDGVPLAIELAASRMVSMTAAEVRDRLDDRFRLLVGSRRGLERHQTLRHAVQWSFDLLDGTERTVLARCSVFAGGFDIGAACAITGADDDLATLDLLDALVRKSLLVADRTSARTRYSMLETIRQFAEEQLIASGEAVDVRTGHARYFAARENDVFALWDGPRQREAYSWITAEMANLRAAYRWASDRDDLDTAAGIVHYSAFVGFWGEQHEPIRWAEELIEPARAVRHRRLAQLYSMATLCFTAGRIEDANRYAAAGQEAITSGQFDEVRRESEPAVGSSFVATGEVHRWVDWCRNVVARRPSEHIHAQALLAIALTMAGEAEEAATASEELLAVADATDNPNLAAWALFAYGTAHREFAPAAAYEALRRGLIIAQHSGSRQSESSIASMLSPLAITQGEPTDALDHAILSLRYYHDCGNVYLIKNPLTILVVLLDRLGHHEPAATISGFADTPFTRSALPEIGGTITHLRQILGDAAYESYARNGEHMTAAQAVAYAFDQVEQARAEVE